MAARDCAESCQIDECLAHLRTHFLYFVYAFEASQVRRCLCDPPGVLGNDMDLEFVRVATPKPSIKDKYCGDKS